MIDERIRLLDELGREFRRVGQESRRPKGRRLGRTPLLVSLVALALSTGAVAGVVSVTSDDETAGLSGLPDRGPLASGTTEDNRAWLLTSARNGDNFCIALRVSGPGPVGPRTGENCGGMSPGRFGATLYGDQGAGSGAEALLYGTAPDGAAEVVARSGDTRYTAPVSEDDRNVPGGFFLLELPPDSVGSPEATAESNVTLLGEDGNALTQEVSIADLIEQSSPY